MMHNKYIILIKFNHFFIRNLVPKPKTIKPLILSLKVNKMHVLLPQSFTPQKFLIKTHNQGQIYANTRLIQSKAFPKPFH